MPEWFKESAVKKAQQMIDAGCQVVAVGPYGIVLRDDTGTLTITRDWVDVEPVQTSPRLNSDG